MPLAKARENAARAEDKDILSHTERKRDFSSLASEEDGVCSPTRAKKVKADSEEDQDSTGVNPSALPADSATEKQEKYIKELEEQNESLQESVKWMMLDSSYWMGTEMEWTDVNAGQWPNDLRFLSLRISTWSRLYCTRSRTGKYDHLSKEQKERLMASMEGWVIQDGFDSVVSRLPPNARRNALRLFSDIILLKEILSLFFTNPFWYLEWPVDQDMSNQTASIVESPFSIQLNTLYKRFLASDPNRARHWRAQTCKLANARAFLKRRQPEISYESQALRGAKVKKVVAARLANENFRCLLVDEDDPVKITKRETLLAHIYTDSVELAMAVATSHEDLEWRLLADAPTKYYRYSQEIEAAHMHGLWPRESRLDNKQVLAITRPIYWRTNDFGSTKEKVISKGHVFVADPKGRPEDVGSADEEERAKKAKGVESEETDKKQKKPPPKGKAKKAPRKRP